MWAAKNKKPYSERNVIDRKHAFEVFLNETIKSILKSDDMFI